MTSTKASLAVLVAPLFVLALISRSAAQSAPMTFAGSGSNLPITRILAAAFIKDHPGVAIEIPTSIGSTGAIKADIIKNEVGNSTRIITDLLDFSRAKPPQLQEIPVDELIRQCCLKCPIPVNVSCRLDLPEALPAVKVDALQMKQVFQNIVANAVQAMPGGGVLTIRTREDREGGTARISIADTGEGIAPDTMKKLFQPLFTTKPRGIGLGLIVSKNLVEANGRIEVESQWGQGTTFTVILPCVRG